MKIVKLPVGTHASPASDCISIQETPGGRFVLNGSVLVRCDGESQAESVALIGGDTYDSYDAAEAAGLAWVNDHCAETVYVARSDGTTPLPDLP
jgi:hypothetical protein